VGMASLPVRGEGWSTQAPVVDFNDLPRRADTTVPMPRRKPEGIAR